MATDTVPVVSVVMPVLNPHPVYFREAVQSVLAQTFTDFELVIVEDPSAVSGKELIADLVDPRIRHIVNPARTSLVDQRNQGLHAARADIVALLDADDVALPARLQKQLDYLRRHPEVDVLGSQLFIIDQDGKQVGMRSYPLSHELIVQTMSSYNALAQPSVMCRKRVLLDAGGYQYRTYPVNEDYELWSRLLARGVRFANHSETLLRYRTHPLGTKSLMLHRMLRATLDVKARFWRDQMDVWAQMRFVAEHALLGLPANVVLRLFIMTQYISGERRG
jgi:glycosyltransferase involved in cell wall biosynthesis